MGLAEVRVKSKRGLDPLLELETGHWVQTLLELITKFGLGSLRDQDSRRGLNRLLKLERRRVHGPLLEKKRGVDLARGTKKMWA